MKAFLICPEYRSACGVFHRQAPLALMPVCGRTLLDHTLAHLGREGFTHVTLLVSDRVEQIRRAVDKGAAWGLDVIVIPTTREFTPADVIAEFGDGGGAVKILELERLPLAGALPIWSSFDCAFDQMMSALDSETVVKSITVHELHPGIWVSTQASISPTANLHAPVWIGPRVIIKDDATIGPGAILERGSYIDCGAVVQESWVGPSTFVGPATTVTESLAWGNGLLKRGNGSFLEVHDPVLLHDIRRPAPGQRRASLFDRVLAWILFVLLAPLVLPVALARWMLSMKVISERRVILPPFSHLGSFTRTFALQTLCGLPPLLSRWPQFLRVIRGYLDLVGNAPLSLRSATALRGETGRLWLETPAGMFSLADAEGISPHDLAAALPCAARFSLHRSVMLRCNIMVRCLARLFCAAPSFSNASSIPTSHEA